jgi:hypothetical protein
VIGAPRGPRDRATLCRLRRAQGGVRPHRIQFGDSRHAHGPGDSRHAHGPDDSRHAHGPGDSRHAHGPGDSRHAPGGCPRRRVLAARAGHSYARLHPARACCPGVPMSGRSWKWTRRHYGGRRHVVRSYRNEPRHRAGRPTAGAHQRGRASANRRSPRGVGRRRFRRCAAGVRMTGGGQSRRRFGVDRNGPRPHAGTTRGPRRHPRAVHRRARRPPAARLRCRVAKRPYQTTGGSARYVHCLQAYDDPPFQAQYRHKSNEGCSANRTTLVVNCVRRRPTLPRSGPRSTIGAERLSFRVRDGTGRFPLAMVAETLWRYGPHRLKSRRGPYLGNRTVDATAGRSPQDCVCGKSSAY